MIRIQDTLVERSDGILNQVTSPTAPISLDESIFRSAFLGNREILELFLGMSQNKDKSAEIVTLAEFLAGRSVNENPEVRKEFSGKISHILGFLEKGLAPIQDLVLYDSVSLIRLVARRYNIAAKPPLFIPIFYGCTTTAEFVVSLILMPHLKKEYIKRYPHPKSSCSIINPVGMVLLPMMRP